ncbi:MAG: M48 family metallopeptidase [Piscinibacter sp.]
MSEPLRAEYFDGRSALAHAVALRRDGEALAIEGDGVAARVPLERVRWPERTRHGVRVAELPGGASLQCADAAAWDAFALECGRGDGAVVRAQQSWRAVLASLTALVALLAGLYVWGIPAAAHAALGVIPASVDAAVGEVAMRSIDEEWMKPSMLDAAEQQRLRAAFEKLLSAQPQGSVPAHRLEFRKSRIGPNAFALPGGTIVMTDELVKLVDGDAAVIAGVLAHELGHVRHRDGMRMLIQASAVGVLASVVVGDFNSLLATVPVVLGQSAYSRDAERRADEESARLLRDAGLSPAVMVGFFEKLAKEQGEHRLGIAIASHPADEERIRFFREAAAQPRR